ncbi:hypothetical protein lerEdw1_007531, partial [Lerista edwardsae]
GSSESVGGGAVGAEPRRRARGLGSRSASSSSSAAAAAGRCCYEVVRELGPEEVRWFYREDRKSWKPFIGYDSLRIERAFRAVERLSPAAASPAPTPTAGSPERRGTAASLDPPPGPVCVRSGLYEVDVANAECYPVYWNQTEKIPVMRGQWFVDGTWQPLEEEESNLIEQEHLSCFKGQQLPESFDMEVAKPVDGKEGLPFESVGIPSDQRILPLHVCVHLWISGRLSELCIVLFYDVAFDALQVGPGSFLLIPNLPLVRYHSIHSTFDVPSTLNSTDLYLCGSVCLFLVTYHLPPFSLHSLFQWRGYKENAEAAGLKRKRSEAIHSLKLSRNHVDWHSVDEVYLYSDATTSKIARTVTQKLGFSKASSSGTRLHRGYVEEATLEDKPSPTTHIVFVVHGIGQKMDQGRIIKNTAMMRDTARKIEEKYFSNLATHVEFLPVEWRSKLALDGDTVDSITPDKVRGLRDMLNSSAMDIMYYTSPLYRDEAEQLQWGSRQAAASFDSSSARPPEPPDRSALVKGLQQELNRLYTLFCSRNPEFTEKGGKVSIVSHSLGCVITYDIMTGWNPVRLYEQLLEKEYEELEDQWMTYEEQHLLEEFYLTKQRNPEMELDHRIDFELREGLVESRYWSAVTSHTAYWSSMDIALFLLTFMYKQDQEEDCMRSHLDTV